MADDRLSDEEVHDRLQHAVAALGKDEAQTVRGTTALDTARSVLSILQFALVKAAADGDDQLEGVRPSERD